MLNIKLSSLLKGLIPFICFMAVLLPIKYAVPMPGADTLETNNNTKSTKVFMQQYEKQLSQDSCLVCMPDTAHMLLTKHHMFAISGVIRVWAHKIPTYDGFKEYISRIDSLHNVKSK